MFVMGIDPGLSRCGYAILKAGKAGRANPLAMGVITTPKDAAVPLRLAELQTEFRSLMAEFQPHVVAVERVFFQNNVTTAVGVAQASGLALVEAVAAGAFVAEYSPNQIKAAVTGDGRADKAMMQTMVKTLLGLKEVPRPADAADAAALALCHLAYDPAGTLSSRAPGRLGLSGVV